MPTPQRLARIAGGLYLVMVVCGGFAEIVRVTVYQAGDAATTAANLATHAGLVRASVLADLIAVPTGLFTAMALYLLLKHVHANAARTMVAFLAIAAAMMALNLTHQYQALHVSDPAYTEAFSGQGSDALVLLMLDLHHHGYLMTQVFFGLWLLPMGYLVYRSGMIPRVIGILLAVGCFGYLTDTFARFTTPDLGAALSPYVLTPAAVAEVSMMLWLLIKGAKVPQPDRLAPPAATVNLAGEVMELGVQSRVSGGGVNCPATAEGTMRAIVQDGYGSDDVLRLARIATPTIVDNEVLVRVHAAGLDRGTWHLMTGRPYLLRLFFGIRRPRRPVAGRDVAGRVAAVGSAVTRFAVGDEVFGVAPGSFAEYAVAKEDKLVRKPANLTFEQAAVVPVSATVALQAVDAGGVKPGQRVLITGASGGVGSYAVQLAKALEAHVTGVCSTSKRDLVRSLGADHVIDYTREDFTDRAHNYDVILDIAGNPALSRLRRALTSTGTVVLIGGEEGGKWTGGVIDRQLLARTLSLFIRQRFTSVLGTERGSDLQRVTALIDAGAVTPSLDRTYPLDQVPQAMRHLDLGQARGKIAITI